MSVRLGVNPIAWSNDDMRELGGGTALETCLTEARAAGFEGIELGHKFPREASTLRPIFTGHNLDLVSGWYSTGLLERGVDDEWTAIQDHAGLLRDMGCGVIILAETTGAIHGEVAKPLGVSPVLSAGELKELAERLTELSKRLTGFGLKTAYHHHMGTVVETADAIDQLMNCAGQELGLLLDTGHALFAGADPLELAAAYGTRITHVHCKDVRAEKLEAARVGSFLDGVVDGVFTVPGDGVIGYPPVLKVLADVGYDGWLVVEAEQDPEKANPAKYAALGFENLKRMAGEAGLV